MARAVGIDHHPELASSAFVRSASQNRSDDRQQEAGDTGCDTEQGIGIGACLSYRPREVDREDEGLHDGGVGLLRPVP